MKPESSFTPEEWETCLKVLKVLSRSPEQALDTQTLKGLVTKLHKNARKSIRKENLQQLKAMDREILSQTVLHQKNPTDETQQPLLEEKTTESRQLARPHTCYISKDFYRDVHFFYHLLCPQCAKLNYDKRNQRAALDGRTALVTGGRIKIGYLTALRLLRDGANVLITTRFPNDCARRFSEEPDFAQWQHRLRIYGLDLRNIPMLEQFIQYLLDTEPALDIIVNNAAQTVKRPLEFYRHLLESEQTPDKILSPHLQKLLPFYQQPFVPLLEYQKQRNGDTTEENNYFPVGKLDKDRQQIDLRPQTSWTLKLDEVDTTELLEVQLVNSIAPFLLNSKLKKLLQRSAFDRKFIINVSAMEGQFGRKDKTVFHPHTNMAKAALNMMTRTSAADYAESGIYMTSVDTGWITQENPFPKKVKIRQKGFVTPLDETDGMARIYDPIVRGLTEETTPLHGCFLKDYQPYPW